jgi:hypothetical protein
VLVREITSVVTATSRGRPSETATEVVDAGIFCSKTCAAEYLRPEEGR